MDMSALSEIECAWETRMQGTIGFRYRKDILRGLRVIRSIKTLIHKPPIEKERLFAQIEATLRLIIKGHHCFSIGVTCFQVLLSRGHPYSLRKGIQDPHIIPGENADFKEETLYTELQKDYPDPSVEPLLSKISHTVNGMVRPELEKRTSLGDAYFFFSELLK